MGSPGAVVKKNEEKEDKARRVSGHKLGDCFPHTIIMYGHKLGDCFPHTIIMYYIIIVVTHFEAQHTEIEDIFPLLFSLPYNNTALLE
jgi:hypothetical protein